MFKRYMDQLREIDWFYLNKIRKLNPIIAAQVALMNIAMGVCLWRWLAQISAGEPPFSRLTVVTAMLFTFVTVVVFALSESREQEKRPTATLVVRGSLVVVPCALLWSALDLQSAFSDLSGGHLQAAVFAVLWLWLFGWDLKLAHPFHHMRRVEAPQKEAMPMPTVSDADLSKSKDLAREQPVDAEIVDEPAPQTVTVPGGLGQYFPAGNAPRTVYSGDARTATE